MNTRILLVDDHHVVLDGLSAVLGREDDMSVVGMADNGAKAIDLAREYQPDVVVLDVSMPELNGITAVAKIREVAPKSKVLALSMHTGGKIVSDMMRAGASGYVVKSSKVDEVTQAIRAVVAGKTYLSPEIAGKIVDGLFEDSGSKGSSRSLLTPREKEVIQMIADGKSSKAIAAQLNVTQKTIEWHRKNIMDKVEIRNIAELTKYAIREGLTTLDE